jgi:hypothetical protein
MMGAGECMSKLTHMAVSTGLATEQGKKKTERRERREREQNKHMQATKTSI